MFRIWLPIRKDFKFYSTWFGKCLNLWDWFYCFKGKGANRKVGLCAGISISFSKENANMSWFRDRNKNTSFFRVVVNFLSLFFKDLNRTDLLWTNYIWESGILLISKKKVKVNNNSCFERNIFLKEIKRE